MFMWRLTLEEQLGTARPFFVFAIILTALSIRGFRISTPHLSGLSPSDYYALAEQRTAGYGPDVLALQL